MGAFLASLRWLLPSAVPVILFVVLGRNAARRDAKREPFALVFATFALGALGAVIATIATRRAAAVTGLTMLVAEAGQRGAIIFLFLVVAPLREVSKAAAAWPALLLKHFDEPYDGVVYAAASALGFSAVQIALTIHGHPSGAIWIARALVALPAEVFFACIWGYALGRANHVRRGLPLFPVAFAAAIGAHGLYAYFVYGRGPGALLATTPLLSAMAIVSWLLGRDLQLRADARPSTPSRPSHRSGRISRLTQPPSLSAVRAALRGADEPVRLGWIAFGALVTMGAMIAGLAAGVGAAHALGIDLSTVDEHDVGSASPVLLLGAGLLAAFPTSGWLVARAASVRTLLEPALAAVLALFVALVTLGFTAPFMVVFALALSPFAWLLACIGAWVGRVA